MFQDGPILEYVLMLFINIDIVSQNNQLKKIHIRIISIKVKRHLVMFSLHS